MRALLLAAAAAWVALPSSAVAAPPSNYDQGVAARLAGENDRAITLLQQVVVGEPQNADAQLQLGLALLAAGQLDEAEQALRRTLALAPGYQDAKDALARLEQRRSASQAVSYRSRIDIDGRYSALSHGAADWAEGSVRLTHQIDPDTALSAAFEPSRRFGRSDVYGEVRIDRRFSDAASIWLLLGGTPNADFRPEWQVGAGGALRVSDGPYATVLTVEGRHAQYPAGDVRTFTPGIEQYVGGGSWLTAKMINVFDRGDHEAGWLARGDWMATPTTRLFAGAADAPDLSEGVVTRVFSLFGGISADLSDRTTLRLSVTREDRDGPVDRLEISAGIGWRF